MVGGDERLIGGFGLLRGQDAGGNQDAVAEGDGLAGVEREVQLLFTIGENFLPERVGGKKTIAASVPVGWKARILRVVEDGYGDGLVADTAAEIAPTAARSPNGFAFFGFTGEIDAVDASVVQLGDSGGAAGGVGEDFGFVGGRFEGT